MSSTETISMSNLKDIYLRLGPGERILDVRSPEEFAEGHVPGASNITHEKVGLYLPELSCHRKIYIHCESGRRAETVVQELSQKGLSNLVLVKDSGMEDWRALGLPEVKGSH